MRDFIRVDCGWGAEGLWTESGRMISLDSLPLSAGLKQRLLAWNDDFTERAEPWNPSSDFDLDAHRSEGQAIARALKAELPDTDVIVFGRRVNADGSLGDRVSYPGERSVGN